MKTRHMTNMNQKIDELKSSIGKQFCSRDKKLEELCGNLFKKFRKQIELQVTNELKKQSKRIKELGSGKIMLQQQILEITKQILQNQQEIEELKQYDRRLCLRFEGISTEKNETSDKVLEKIMGIYKDSGIEIPDTVIDQTHRTGVQYVDKNTKKLCKSVIVQFSIFCHRTIVYQAK